MAIDTSVWSEDVDGMVADMPAILEWDGQTVSVTASPETRTDDVGGDGVLFIRTREIACKLSAFTGSVPPEVRDVVSVDGRKYHVTERTVDAAGVHMQLRRI